MKQVVLSFDDGRLDTYMNAVPILERYGLTATINITTDFILHPEAYNNFQSADNRAMSVAHVQELYRTGFEIASHGNRHINDPNDVRESIRILHGWGIEHVCGFASPESVIDEKDFPCFQCLIEEGTLRYIRSGLRVRKQGLAYTGMHVLQNILKSDALFFYLNRKTVIQKGEKQGLFFGVSITKDTTVRQITHFIEKIPEDTAVVMIFHSILSSNEQGYGLDKWYWETERFELLCRALSSDRLCSVKKSAELC